MKALLKKLIPGGVLGFYYLSRECLAALRFGFPSRKITVIGVTGTNGKTTVTEMLSHILNEAGFATASISSLYFRTKQVSQSNKLKMTLPSRSILQGFIKQALNAGVKYLIIETTSEGIKQFRHRFIDYNGAVFTNLSPEHIEVHQGLENYKQAKGQLFKKVAEKRGGFSLVNLDDSQADYFLSFRIAKKYGYSLAPERAAALKEKYQLQEVFAPQVIEETTDGFALRLNDWEFSVGLKGRFNVSNSLAAIGAARVLGLSWQEIHQGLDSFHGVPGRLEEIDEGQDFKVVVDYAHTPDALQKVYETLKSYKLKAKSSRLIAVLGSAGGGRDKWKRPELGKIAARYADVIILTDEDPYDENPRQIMEEIERGFSQIRNPKPRSRPKPKAEIRNSFYEILDRKEAIKKAIELARPGDTVVITGKGAEPWMVTAGGKKIPWDDRQIAREALQSANPKPEIRNSKQISNPNDSNFKITASGGQ
jgi:UDP-N-acetylmuramoyl-L-alanyl-D-glutamate--2,6-diaminopimelate ligase